MPARRRPGPPRSGSRPWTKPPGSTWPASPPRPPDRAGHDVPRDDLTSTFHIARNPAASSEDGRPEPRFGAIPLQVELDEARRIEAGHAATQPSASSQLRGRTLPFGMLGALAVHLSPLLLLLSWTSAPAEIVEPIPVELVLEQP